MKNFECLNCHHKFEVDDSMEVTCPHCGSENVRPVGKSLSKPLLFTAVFLVAFAIGFFVIKAIKGSDSSIDTGLQTEVSYTGGGGAIADMTEIQTSDGSVITPEDNTPKNPSIDLQEKKIEKEAEKVPVKQPVTIAIISTPKADANGTYSFAVKAEHLPADVTVSSFTLTDVSGTNIIATSSDGRFIGVPASADKGQYNLKVDLSNGEIVTRDRIGGFDKVEKVDNRLQAEELTSLLNSRNKELGLGKNPKVIRKPKIIINNTTDANDEQVTLIDDIYSRLEFGSWSSVTVTSVEYDSQGRVNKFAIDKHI